MFTRMTCVASLALATASAAQIDVLPTGAPAFPGAAWPIQVVSCQAAGDFNGDGYPDVVLAAFDVSVALNNGHGLLAPVSKIATGSVAYDVTTGDVDGDGHVDVVAVGNSSGGYLGVFRGSGDGSLQLELTLVEPSVARVALLDLNSDGALDIAAGYGSTGTMLRLLTNDGAGGFSPPSSFGIVGAVTDLEVADMNLDGDQDLVTAHSPEWMYVVSSDGAGGLQTSDTYFPTGRSVAVGDIDGDGWPDVVTRSGKITPPAAWATQYRRNNHGVLPILPTKTWHSIIGGTNAVPVAIADLALDGGADIIAENSLGLVVVPNPSVLPGDPVVHPASSGLIEEIDVADFDGDGRPDVLITANSASDGAVILTSAAGVPQVAPVLDLGASGVVYARSIDAADLDGDGWQDVVIVDSGDVKLRVAHGTGPSSFSFTSVSTEYGTTQDLHLVDVTGDGNLDALFAAYETNGLLLDDVVVHAGDGLGGFGSKLLSSFTPDPTMSRPADFDGDGRVDVAVLCRDPGLVMLRRGDDSGTFAPWGSVALPWSDGHLAVGDLDGDGALDVAVSRLFKGIVVAHGDGAGGLAAPVGLSADTANSNPLIVQDLDADGDSDVAVAWTGPAGIGVLRNDGAGFAAPVLGGLPAGGIDLACADIDGDGALDLVEATAHSCVIVVPTDGACGLRPAAAHPTGKMLSANSLVLRDMNSDSRLDLLALGHNVGYDAVTIALNTGGSANPWLSIGGGVAGDAGQPRLRGTGQPVSGQIVQLEAAFAPPLAPATMFLGLDQLGLPFKGGLLVPTPDALLFLGFTSASGKLTLAAPWPAGAPAGLDLWMQVWFPDGSAPHGVAATGGLRLRVP